MYSGCEVTVSCMVVVRSPCHVLQFLGLRVMYGGCEVSVSYMVAVRSPCHEWWV